MDVKKLRIGQWYEDGNILFMPRKKLDRHPFARNFGKYDLGAYEVIYTQDPRHMNFYIYDPKRVLGIFQERNGYPDQYDDSEQGEITRQYLFDIDRENVLEHKDITKANEKAFRKIIESIFERDEEHEHYRKMK